MTGLTTTAALYKLHFSIKKALEKQPRYTVSPYISWSLAVSVVIFVVWIVICGLYLNMYVSAILGLLLSLTILFLVFDTLLSCREKTDSVKDILDILQTYNVTHEVQRSSASSTKQGFYLNETYPSSTSVSVQRVYRNGKVVSVGRTLLVEGDIILLSPGEEAPTPCVSLSGDVTLDTGDIFADKATPNTDVKDCVIEQANLPTLFSVTKTEYQTLVQQFLQTVKLPSKLCLEIQNTLKILNAFVLPSVLVLSVAAGVVQFKYLSSGTEMECVLVTLLPLLPTVYLLYYTVVYHISTAIVINTAHHTALHTEHTMSRDPMKTPDNNTNSLNRTVRDFKTTKRILFLTYKIVVGKLYHCLPRNSNIFDTLSAVTVLCTVNKEGILSRPNPHVERIMLLDPALPEVQPEQQELGLDPVEEIPVAPSDVSSQDRARLFSTTSETDYEREGDPLLTQTETSSLPNIHAQSEDHVKKVRSLQNSFTADSKFSIESEYRKLAEVSIEADLVIDLPAKSSEKLENRKSKLWLPRIVSSKKRARARSSKEDRGDQEEQVVEPELEISPMLSASESKVKKKRKHFWQVMKIPRYRSLRQEEEHFARETESDSQQSSSLKDDFIVVLNVSLCKHSPFGLSFDCKNARHLHGSLKPVGLAVLLNNTCHGTRSVTSSHLHFISIQHYCGLTFKLPLPTDYCNCVIGREIGFTRSILQQYHKLSTIVTYVPCTGDNTRRTQRNPADNMTPLTCIVSSVVRDKVTGRRHLMSYGTAPFILNCCYHYWTGKEVLPLLPEHRVRVLEFYNQNRLTSHCFVVSYRPLLGHEIAPQNDVFLSLPKGHGFLDEVCSAGPLDPAENLLKLQSGQTLLGVLCAQFQPKHDVVSTIERLVAANIRFVHFSYDNELRSRAFGTKLGLETGWNCHISLAEGDFDNFSVDSDSNEAEAETFHFYYCKARLPQGIKNIRPHLANVDNVPLLVPLFTSCTPPAIKEMISVMQENHELVCCVGSSLQVNNFNIFLQADSSLGMIPHLPQNCLISGIKDMSLPWVSSDYRTPPLQGEDFVGMQVNCLHLTSILNTLPCSLVLSRDHMCLEELIRAARTTSVAVRHSGYLTISMYGVVCIWSLIHQFLLLPPPISLSGCLSVCLFAVPLLASTPFSIKQDGKIMELHTGKREPSVTESAGRHLKHFLLRWCSVFLLSPLVTLLSLYLLCNGDCTPLIGARSAGRFTQESVTLVQRYNCVLIVFVLASNAFTFAHRTKPLNLSYFLYTFTKWTAIIPLGSCVSTILIVMVYTALSGHHPNSPPYPLASSIAILPLLQLGLSELSKMYDRKLFTRDQRRQKLKFGTKLGMNSPF